MIKTSELAQLRTDLRAERIKQRRTQAELAAQLGRSRKWLSDYERGAIDPSLSGVLALAAALGFKVKLEAPDDWPGADA